MGAAETPKMDAIMEEHIRFEAEEANQISDHVWEEVVIEDTDSITTWKDDLEDEDGSSLANDVELVPENEEEDQEILTEAETDQTNDIADVKPPLLTDISNDFTDTESSPTSVATSTAAKTGSNANAVMESSTVSVTTNATETPKPTAMEIVTSDDVIKQSPPTPVALLASVPNVAGTPSLPIVTSVKSLAPRPIIQKVINMNQLKLLPKGGGFINIGNKRVKLIPYTGDKKLIAGKVVTVTGNSNKMITGKMVSLSNSNKIMPKMAKVVTVPSSKNSTATATIAKKVVPAKVVSIGNTRLKPIAPKNKEVTIYITGLAGDKVQIRDSAALPMTQSEDEGEGWRHSILPSNLSAEEWANTEVTDGHFLLDNGKILTTGTFACDSCDRQFTQLKYLLSHQQTHILSEPVSCDSCDKQFKRRYDLLRHKRRAHADNTIYECDVCHKTFEDSEVANKHRLTHTEDFKYCCEVCNRPFRHVHDLKRHRSIHFDEKPFDCEICGKKFKHKSNLKTHQSTHYSEKPFSCTLCDKRFHQKGNLKTHLIVHTGEMPFVCNICTKRFHTRSGLLNHSYSHSDEKPFQCDICEKTFNWKSGLLTHQQTHRRSLSIDPQIITEDVEVIEIGPIPVDN